MPRERLSIRAKREEDALQPAQLGLGGSLPPQARADESEPGTWLAGPMLGHRFGSLKIQSGLAPTQVVQRDDAGGPPPSNAGPVALPTFDFAEKHNAGKNFDSHYTPVGPAPATGTLNIDLWIYIDWRNFSMSLLRNKEFKGVDEFKGWRPTAAQRAQFAWLPEEKQKFEIDFMSGVMNGWSGKHMLALKNPAFSEYRCAVNVNVITVDNPKLAHFKLVAQKMPPDAPRIRSFVNTDESKAVLDSRDPNQEESHNVRDLHYVRQIGPFEIGTSETNSLIDAQMNLMKLELQDLKRRTPDPERKAFLIGRGSSPGSEKRNKALGQERAEVVKTRMTSDLGSDAPATMDTFSLGESHATPDPKFQRVDVGIGPKDATNEKQIARKNVTQNTAMHEAGHMFGLGDEYVEEERFGGAEGRFTGDEPSHYGDVEATLGYDEAHELLAKNSGSIMSAGSTVQKGHYVYFVQALNAITGQNWKVE